MPFQLDSQLIDTTLTLHYPTVTHVRYSDVTKYLQRQFRVLQIRDLVREPLTPMDFLRRPYVRRSRYLLLGQEQRYCRQFYLGCSAEYQSPTQLRVALYEPSGAQPVELLARPIEADVRDRKLLIRLLEKWRDRDFGGLVLRVYADDLRLLF
jgi:hypothetical protein